MLGYQALRYFKEAVDIAKDTRMQQQQNDKLRMLAKQNSESNLELKGQTKLQLQQNDKLGNIAKQSSEQTKTLIGLSRGSELTIKNLNDQLKVNSGALNIQNKNYTNDRQAEYYSLQNTYLIVKMIPTQGWYFNGKSLGNKDDKLNLVFFKTLKEKLELGFDIRYFLKDSTAFSLRRGLYHSAKKLLEHLSHLLILKILGFQPDILLGRTWHYFMEILFVQHTPLLPLLKNLNYSKSRDLPISY